MVRINATLSNTIRVRSKMSHGGHIGSLFFTMWINDFIKVYILTDDCKVYYIITEDEKIHKHYRRINKKIERNK